MFFAYTRKCIAFSVNWEIPLEFPVSRKPKVFKDPENPLDFHDYERTTIAQLLLSVSIASKIALHQPLPLNIPFKLLS